MASSSSLVPCCPSLALDSERPYGKHPGGLDGGKLVKEGHTGGFTKPKTPHQPLKYGTPRGLGQQGVKSVSFGVEAGLASALVSCVVWAKLLDP